MNTRYLYDITGNICDYNDVIINRYELKQLHDTIEQLQLQLAACLTVAEADTEESANQAAIREVHSYTKGSFPWSKSMQVCALKEAARQIV